MRKHYPKERLALREREKKPVKAIRPNISLRGYERPGADKGGFNDTRWGRTRVWVVGGFMGLAAFVLWCRVFYIQIINGPEYAERAARQHSVAEVTAGQRGVIYDRNGVVLARSVEHFSIYARPAELADMSETTLALSKILNIPVARMRKILTEPKGFVWVARKVDDKAAKDVREAKLRGVYLTPEYERIYPNRHAAGQLLGFVGIDGKGLEGLEGAFQTRLSASEARQIITRDARGRRIYLDGKEEAEKLSGQDLHLTIDLVMQMFAEQALEKYISEFGAKWGGCIVIDIESAEIRAWAQYPFFNPNSYQNFSQNVRRDKLALDSLEQGSTMKAFTMATALQEKIVDKNTEFNCENGQWKFRNVVIRDTSPHGVLPVHKIFRVSSNIGSAKVGLKLGAQTYWGYLDRLGFGRRTGLPLMGESVGILRHYSQWGDVDTANSAFGQSFSATAAQVAQAYLCLVSGGIKRQLKLVADDIKPKTEGAADPLLDTNASYRVYSEEVSRQLLEFLTDVVEKEGGTGALALIPGLKVGGKTGTAQKADASGRYGSKRVASFVGVVPADKPRYLIVAIIDEPVKNSYGGVVAAPVFREVAMRTLSHDGYLPVPEDPMQAALLEAGKLKPDAQIRQSVKEQKEKAAQERYRALQAQRENPGPQVQEFNPEKRLQAPSTQKVPNMLGLDVREAVELCSRAGVLPKLYGSGSIVIKQKPEAGQSWPEKKNGQEAALWPILWLGER